MTKKDDAVSFVWKLILNRESISLDEIKKTSIEEGFNEKSVESALDALYKMYFIEYTNDYQNGIFIKKRDILGFPFEDFPCLGCEHLHECSIGGDRYSPEKCLAFENWIQRVTEMFRK